MKKWIITLAALFVFTGTSMAATVAEDCGCGLGKVAIGEQEGLGWNLLGTWLNGISGNQTFGMSSGTLGCSSPAKFASNERMDVFVADNMDNLAVDIASGEGESLNALMEIAQISGADKAKATQTLQANFDAIYPDARIGETQVASSIRGVLAQI